MVLNKTKRMLVVAAIAPLIAMSACASDPTSTSDAADKPKVSAFEFDTIAEDTADVCEAGKEGGSFNHRMYPEGAGMDPAVSQSNPSASGAIYGTLIRWNSGTLAFEPEMAASIEGSEDSKTWTLKLRDDVEYSDGTKLDSAAVKANLERYVSPDFPSTFTSRVAEIDKIDTPDDTTVVFTLKRAWGTFPFLLTQQPGMIINPKVLKSAKPEELSSNPPANAGAGAFEFASYERGQNAKFKAKSDWWGGPVCIQDLTLSFSSADSVADYEALNAGQVSSFMSYDAAVIGRADKDAKLNLFELPGALLSPIQMNLTRKPFDDARVRQAFQQAMDRDLINARNYENLALAGGAIVPPNFPYQPSVKALEFDEAAAKAKIEEAGATGAKFDYTVNRNPSNENLAILQQALLKNIGVEMNLDMLQVQEWIEKVFATRNFDTAQGGITMHASCAFCGLDVFSSTSSSNVGSVNSPSIDAALEKLMAAKPGDETVAALDEVQTAFNEEAPAVMTIWLPQVMAANQDLRGVRFSTTATHVMFEKAYLAK